MVKKNCITIVEGGGNNSDIINWIIDNTNPPMFFQIEKNINSITNFDTSSLTLVILRDFYNLIALEYPSIKPEETNEWSKTLAKEWSQTIDLIVSNNYLIPIFYEKWSLNELYRKELKELLGSKDNSKCPINGWTSDISNYPHPIDEYSSDSIFQNMIDLVEPYLVNAYSKYLNLL